jgi:Valyl-tRNA synthetase
LSISKLRSRGITKELEKAHKQLEAQIAKLSNENFVSRAPQSVVDVERDKKTKFEALIENLEISLKNLS